MNIYGFLLYHKHWELSENNNMVTILKKFLLLYILCWSLVITTMKSSPYTRKDSPAKSFLDV